MTGDPLHPITQRLNDIHAEQKAAREEIRAVGSKVDDVHARMDVEVEDRANAIQRIFQAVVDFEKRVVSHISSRWR